MQPQNDSDSAVANTEADSNLSPVTEAKSLYDAIALKAYFIALDRHARGEPADALQDWLEAERQLKPPLNE